MAGPWAPSVPRLTLETSLEDPVSGGLRQSVGAWELGAGPAVVAVLARGQARAGVHAAPVKAGGGGGLAAARGTEGVASGGDITEGSTGAVAAGEDAGSGLAETGRRDATAPEVGNAVTFSGSA